MAREGAGGNPIGALLWLVSGVLLAISLPSVQRQMLGWVAAIGSGFASAGRRCMLPSSVVWTWSS